MQFRNMSEINLNHVGGSSPTIPPVDTTISPGSDFYMYVNKRWQKSTSIPSFASSYGVSEEIEERVRGDLMKSIQKCIRSEPNHPISLLARSVLHTPSQSNNIRDIRHYLQTFNCMRDIDDIGRAIGRLNRIQCRAPLTFSVNADSYKSSECRVHIYEPVLGLPAKHHYQSNPRNRIIMMYGSILKKMGELLEVEDLEAVIPIEKSVIPYLSEGDSLRNPSEFYIPMKYSELHRRYKHIPWKSMLVEWGMKESLIDTTTFILTNDDYINGLNTMFRTVEMASWRIWLRACVVLTFMEYLPPPFDDMHYELFGKRLRGNSQKLPQKFLMLRVIQTFATQALGKIYIDDHVDEKIKDIATDMVKELKKATINRIMKTTWMLEKTKHIAAEKVEAMRFQVAYPNVWTNEFTGLTMNPERMIQNIIQLCEKDTDRMISTIGSECGKTNGKWDDGTFDVNAYYYPDRNQLTIPAGMLRPPFFDLRRSMAWNYGAIGSAIGHEITHGFDADGKNYDLHGSYKDWWSTSDNDAYDKMTKQIIAMYDGEKYLGGSVDGHLTLSENIADIGGISIALDALHKYLDSRKVSKKERLDAYHDFFLSFAISWRNKDRPRKAKQSLYLDVHAPAPLRVNIVVRQFQEFYDAFGITESDPGWIPPEKRVHLW